MKIADIEPQARKNLLRLAETYAEAKGYKLATVSRRAHGDPRFFDSLKEQEQRGERTDSKGSFTIRVYSKLITWFYSNWPEIEFPELHDLTHDIERINYGAPQRIEESSEGGRTRTKDGSKEARPTGKGKGGVHRAGSLLAKLRRGL